VYGSVFEGDEFWRGLTGTESTTFSWDPGSTYIKQPPYFTGLKKDATPPGDIENARALLVLGDSVTTDHISPAGAIPSDYPAGRYLIEEGVASEDFNSYGSRRGNHEVMMRGTFANIRLKNALAGGREGGLTVRLPEGEEQYVYDAAMTYQAEGTPLVVLAGKEYGAGSSRDWAAKGTYLLGVRAVIARSYERIHRSNLVGMGVLPLEFKEEEDAAGLGLDGTELFSIRGLDRIEPRGELEVLAAKADGSEIRFNTVVRLNTPIEMDFYRHGGILPYVLRKMTEAG
jgi:aconitate hydratase